MVKKKALFALGFALLFFGIVMVLVAISNQISYEAEYTYEKYYYEDVVVIGTFLVKGQPAQPAIYEDDVVVTLNSTNGEGTEGSDHYIPDDATNIVTSENVCWESFNSSGEPEYLNGDGCTDVIGVVGLNSLALQGITIGYEEPEAGDSARIMSGEISYTIPGELVTPYVKATEDKTVETMIVQEYNDQTGEKTNVTCYQNGGVVDCTKVEWYTELYSTVDEQAKITQTSEMVTETLEYNTRTDSWSATSGGKMVDPEELVNYDSMKKEIDDEIKANN